MQRRDIFFRSCFHARQFSLKFVSQFCSKKRSHIARRVARRLESVSLVTCVAFNVPRDANGIEMIDPLPFQTRSVTGERNDR